MSHAVLRTAARKCLSPMLRRAARAYAAGDTLNDALAFMQRPGQQSMAATVGYWNYDSDTAEHVFGEYAAGIRSLAERNHTAYLSIKAPAIGYSLAMLEPLADAAIADGVRLHFDAMAPDSVDRTWSLMDSLLQTRPGAAFSVTAPGRWRRSCGDARWAIERGLAVRVVKGQWADPDQPDRDVRDGFLEVIDALAGHARHVAVATHDPQLARAALQKLIAAETSCELELLHGLPRAAAVQVAAELRVATRLYVPYGAAFLPYAMSKAASNPRLLWWLLRDMFAARRSVAVA